MPTDQETSSFEIIDITLNKLFEITASGNSTTTINSTGSFIVETNTKTIIEATNTGSTIAMPLIVNDDLIFSGDPNNEGSILVLGSQIFIDNETIASGTTISNSFSSIAQPTLQAINPNVTTTSASTLYIEGAPIAGTNQTISNSYALNIESGDVRVAGNMFANEFHTLSDAKMKTNIQPLENSLEIVGKIKTYEYNWKNENMSKKKQFGVLAQQLEEIGLDNLVSENETNKSVNYINMIGLLINSVNELNKKIDLL